MNKRRVELGVPVRKGKLVFNGETKICDIYRVDINQLFYNDENGRISTFLSQYKSTHTDDISTLDFDTYNDILMQFIISSCKKEKFKSTKENIRELGQIKVGIILEDGRIIDGNRRFTCLRELYKETKSEKYKYFECYVLPAPTTEQEKIAIKSLELNYQFGEDEKEDYNPIDRLVEAYKYLVDPNTKLFTPEEYNQRIQNQMSINNIKLMMIKSRVMYEYLEFIGKKEEYYIARDFQLDGPFQELATLRKKLGEDSEEWFRIAPIFYTTLPTLKGDKSRELRNLIKVYTKSPSDFRKIEEHVFNKTVLSDTLNSANLDEDVKLSVELDIKKTNDDIVKTIKTANTKISIGESRQKQRKIIVDTLKKLNTIDNKEIILCNSEEKQHILNELDKLEDKINELKKLVENVKQL